MIQAFQVFKVFEGFQVFKVFKGFQVFKVFEGFQGGWLVGDRCGRLGLEPHSVHHLVLKTFFFHT